MHGESLWGEDHLWAALKQLDSQALPRLRVLHELAHAKGAAAHIPDLQQPTSVRQPA